MYRNVQDALTQWAERRSACAHLERQRQALTELLHKHEQAVAELERSLAKERKDVERLERVSLRSLAAKVMGNREEALAREQAEAAAVEMQYAEHHQMLEWARAELAQLETSRAALGDVESGYRQALEAQAAELMKRGDAHGRAVQQLRAEIISVHTAHREVQEALAVGGEAHRHLAEALQHLDRASSWGTWDMLGGGIFVTMAKNDALDDAAAKVRHAVGALTRFRRELADVGQTVHAELTSADFLRAADYLFDGLLVDWMVQKRIDEAVANMRSVHAQVGAQLQQLTAMEQDLRARLSSAHERYEAAVRLG